MSSFLEVTSTQEEFKELRGLQLCRQGERGWHYLRVRFGQKEEGNRAKMAGRESESWLYL